jgi:uncharacterized membrane protein
MGDGMRALKIAVIVMGVLIVLGTIGLVIGIARRASAPAMPPSMPPLAALPASVSALLDEPEGTHIVAIAALRDRLAIQLQGGGADRVVLIDPLTGTIAGRIALAR